jgi:hypothetical protein
MFKTVSEQAEILVPVLEGVVNWHASEERRRAIKKTVV